MENKLVSIIIPLYNNEKFIGKCLDSAINQIYSNTEIIVINDGSTDNSVDVVKQYTLKDNRIKLINKQNTGVSDTRNIGLKHAQGEYVCFSDADDILSRDYVSYMVDLMMEDSVDIVSCNSMFGNYDGRQTKKVKKRIISGEKAAISLLSYRVPIGVYSKLFKKSFLERNNIRFKSDLVIGEGFNFNMDAFQSARKVNMSNRKIYYYRRDNATSVTTKFSMKKWRNGLYAIQVIKENLSDPSPAVTKAWHYAYWRTYSDVYDAIVLANAQKKYPEMYKKCKKIVKSRYYYAFKAPVSTKDKIRAMIMGIYPEAIPWLLKKRNKKYNT